MGRRGQREKESPEYLLTHCQRYWAHGVLAPAERSVLPANKVVPQKLYFLSLFPLGNKDFFIPERRNAYDEEITGKTMASAMARIMGAQGVKIVTPLGIARYRFSKHNHI